MNRAWICISRMAGNAMSVAGLAFSLFAVPSALAEPNIEDGTVVLAAVPELRDPFWGRAVLLAAPMPFGGHVGLMLNRPTRFSLSAAFPQHAPSKVVRDPIYFGGPFSTGALVALLLRDEAPGAGAVRLGEQLYLAYDAKLIDRIIEQTPNDARYFAGLVIWHPGELRIEIDRGLWTSHPADEATLFREDTDGLWLELARPAHGLRTQAPAFGSRAADPHSRLSDRQN
jgi:putative transcriptional regulator